MRLNPAQEMEAKKVVATRIISHLGTVPTNAAEGLMRESLESLQEILDKLSAKREREQVQQDAQTQIEEMREASNFVDVRYSNPFTTAGSLAQQNFQLLAACRVLRSA